MIMRVFGITTKDNPYNPLTDYDNWEAFDTEKGYYSAQKLMRIAKIDPRMSEKEENDEVERAIDRLIEIDPFDIYVKVSIDDEKTGGGV